MRKPFLLHVAVVWPSAPIEMLAHSLSMFVAIRHTQTHTHQIYVDWILIYCVIYMLDNVHHIYPDWHDKQQQNGPFCPIDTHSLFAFNELVVCSVCDIHVGAEVSIIAFICGVKCRVQLVSSCIIQPRHCGKERSIEFDECAAQAQRMIRRITVMFYCEWCSLRQLWYIYT